MDNIVKHTGPLFYVQAYSQEMDSLLLNHESYNLQNDPVLAEYLLRKTVEQEKDKTSIQCQLRRKTNL